MRLLTMLTLLVTFALPAAASDLTVLQGNEPLRGQFNAAQDSVRIIFIGAPT